MVDPEFEKFAATMPSMLPRPRKRPTASIWARLWLLWVAIGVCIVLAIVLSKMQTPTGRTMIPSVAQPAWQQSVVNYIKKHEPLLTVDRVYKPESLQNASMYLKSEGVWFGMTGEFTGVSINSSYNPGTGGYCDATCKYGVRVEYQVDEGFDRVGSEDRVFFLKGDYTVTGYAPTDWVRFRGVVTGDAAQKEAQEFLSGQKMAN